eukprot:3466726-Pyramimonas_sp.AAC.1
MPFGAPARCSHPSWPAPTTAPACVPGDFRSLWNCSVVIGAIPRHPNGHRRPSGAFQSPRALFPHQSPL